MKTKNIILIFATILLLSSCVVKSLNPFYTSKTISFDERFLGEWKDGKKGIWKVVAFVDEVSKENPVEKMKEEDLKLYKVYKNSYYIQREYKDKETLYIATPFKINGQTFLDFYPIEHQEGIDNLLESHIVYSHSLVKYDVTDNGKIEVRWLDEDKIEKLFKEKKIKIKHKKIGALGEKYLLTASSKELEKFIKKYINSDDKEKWKTSTKYTLTQINNAE